MIRQRRIAAAILLAAALLGRASLGQYDPPAGYYNAATGTGATLKGQLLNIMSVDHIQRTYGNFRDSAAIHDADPNNPGNILTVYNRASVDATWDLGDTWDREHIWPDSRQPGNASNPSTGSIADPHSLRPCIPSINQSRSNKAFGFETNTGNHASVNADYYFPGDIDKGDVARQLFYSDTRWSSDGLSLTDDLPGGFQMGDLSSLVAWHYLDPPDDFERGRNHKIYSQDLNPLYYTNNRNAFVDRPEYVWSIYVDQQNDSQITIVGGTPNANGDGGTSRDVNLGRVFVGSAVPTVPAFSLNKSSNDGTYFEVTKTGDATSTLSGRHNALCMGATDSKQITVGLNTSTAMAGLRSGSVVIDNLDVTTAGCSVCGADDANDTINLSLTVLEHATPSFANGLPPLATLPLNFGTVTTAMADQTLPFSVFNLSTVAGFTADMDFDSLMPSGDTSVLTTNAAAAAGSLVIAGGAGQMFNATIDTSAVGSFSATYTLEFSDENIAGALDSSLTLMLTGEVLLAGDFNRDHAVDSADYLIWRKSYGQTVAAFALGDGDGDTMVDGNDFALWQEHFGETAAGAGSFAPPANVPEPASIILMMLGFGFLRRVARTANPTSAA